MMTTSMDRAIEIAVLRRDLRALWVSACEADGIDPDAKFVVFTNTPEAAAYNESGRHLFALLTADKPVRGRVRTKAVR